MAKAHIVGIAFLTNGIIGFLFDYVLYPVVIALWGVVHGGIALTIFSIFFNYALVYFYRKTEEDWFGFEALRLKEAETWGKGLLSKILKLGRIPAYILLCIYDAFLGFIYLVGREHSNFAFTKKDWFLFLLSNIIANVAWTAVIGGILEIIKLLILNF